MSSTWLLEDSVPLYQVRYHSDTTPKVLCTFLGGSLGFLLVLPLVELSSKLKWTSHRSPFLVAKLGFEPRQTEPESVVLPLHHLAVCSVFLRRLPFGNRVQNYCFFITYANNFYFFRQNICWFAKKAVILCPIFDYSLWRSA